MLETSKRSAPLLFVVFALLLPIFAGAATDADGDGVADTLDNCLLAANPFQQDADFDGYGTACDADYNNDGIVGGPDLARFARCYSGQLPAFVCEAADHDGSGFVDDDDFAILISMFAGPAGPSYVAEPPSPALASLLDLDPATPSGDGRFCCEGHICPASDPAPDAPEPGQPHPNVVLIVADDLGWNDVGYHGSAIETPTIDQLAADGTRLERFYSDPLCTPTRASLLTGQYAHRSGLQRTVLKLWSEERHGLPGSQPTLAEYLADAGYQTIAAGKWHLGHARAEYMPTEQGFDYFYGALGGAIDYYSHEALDGAFGPQEPQGLDWQLNGRPVQEAGYATDLIADVAVGFLEHSATVGSRRPFFLYLPFTAPHTPLQAPAALVDKYEGVFSGDKQVYAGMVDALDQAIGRVLQALDDGGFAEDTLVVFLSDNGGLQGIGDNRPFRGSKAESFEGGIRVPAVVRWPGVVPAGAISDQRMRAYDLFPTLITATGAPGTPPATDGLDMWSHILDPTSTQERGFPDDGLLPTSVPAGWEPPDVLTDLIDDVDGDGDGFVDGCDNCAATANPTQADSDADGIGDACEA